jgi:hypothetical protein
VVVADGGREFYYLGAEKCDFILGPGEVRVEQYLGDRKCYTPCEENIFIHDIGVFTYRRVSCPARAAALSSESVGEFVTLIIGRVSREDRYFNKGEIVGEIVTLTRNSREDCYFI